MEEIARHGGSAFSLLTLLKRAVGVKGAGRSAYDKFMLRFHDYLKENSGFQQNCPKIPISFPPENSPLRILEKMAGQPLAVAAA